MREQMKANTRRNIHTRQLPTRVGTVGSRAPTGGTGNRPGNHPYQPRTGSLPCRPDGHDPISTELLSRSGPTFLGRNQPVRLGARLACEATGHCREQPARVRKASSAQTTRRRPILVGCQPEGWACCRWRRRTDLATCHDLIAAGGWATNDDGRYLARSMTGKAKGPDFCAGLTVSAGPGLC